MNVIIRTMKIKAQVHLLYYNKYIIWSFFENSIENFLVRPCLKNNALPHYKFLNLFHENVALEIRTDYGKFCSLLSQRWILLINLSIVKKNIRSVSFSLCVQHKLNQYLKSSSLISSKTIYLKVSPH